VSVLDDRPEERPERGDMDPEAFRAAAHRVADDVADYLASVERRPVVPDVEPGFLRERLPAAPPARPESLDAIFADYETLVLAGITHWQHPGFMAYFPSVASGPGILGEWIASGLNSNVMFWKNAPASTELEEVVVSWLRQMLGLPDTFDGMLTDSASVSTLLSLVAARHAVPGLDARDRGLAGRPDVGRLRVYASTETHSSVEKAAIVVGVGREGVRKVPVDTHYAMRADLLARAVAEDRRDGWLPFLAVATVGTTSSTAVDPVRAIADVCERERLWLHVDAAYGGAAALVPEKRVLFEGWERASSIVFNPHKWMFTPFDASLLLFRDLEAFRSAFSLVPDYLHGTTARGAHTYSEYGVQLGRRFRALKLWFLIRWFGADGIAARVREHCRMARELAAWVEAEPGWELAAPVPLATVCLRHAPSGLSEEALDRHNQAILDRVNRTGSLYLSGTRLDGRFTIRVALGNPRAGDEHVRACWRALRDAAVAVE
jgi:aromatic-L-amino-acid decarboxylase